MDVLYHLKTYLCMIEIVSYIIVVMVLLTFTKALEQPQLILKATNNTILYSQFAFYLGQVKVLKPNDLCSFKVLTECHYNGEMKTLYYEACFTEHICPKDNYYCINGVGYTIHICGEFSDCTKRNRNIVEYDKLHPDFVEIYSIPCPDGYFQFSSGNCFHACILDDSVIVIKESTTETHAQGYCNYEKNYCNPDGLTAFTFGSLYDNCVDVKYGDYGMKCNDIEDVMPNCSCVKPCMFGQVRTYDRNFVCQWPNGSNIPKSTTKGITDSEVETTASSHQTSQTIDTNSRGQTPKDDDQENPENGQSMSTLTLVVIVIAVAVVMIAVVIALVCLAYKLLRGRDYREVPVLYNRNEDNREEGSVHCQHENGVAPGTVTKVKNTRETNTKINIQTVGDVHFHGANGLATPKTDILDTASEPGCKDHLSNGSIDEPQMENLKFLGNEEADSGIVSSDTTCVKRPY